MCEVSKGILCDATKFRIISGCWIVTVRVLKCIGKSNGFHGIFCEKCPFFFVKVLAKLSDVIICEN
jgi:hypothetical protein